MKTSSAALWLFLLSQAPSASAFVTPHHSRHHATTQRFSYLSSLGGEDLGNTPQQNNENDDAPKNPKDFFARRADEDRTVCATC
jgi:hypothetical protein